MPVTPESLKRRLPEPVRWRLAALGRWRPVQLARRRWHSNLRTRVVVTTVVLGLALVSLLGTVIYQQVANGLVAQATETAERDAEQQVAAAQEAFESIDRRDDSGLSQAALDAMLQIAGNDAENGRRVLLLPALSNDRGAVVPPLAVGEVTATALPSALQEAVESDPANQQVVIIPLRLTGQQDPVPSVVVSSRVSLLRAGAYDLVIAYPMSREVEALNLIRQLLLAASLGLVLLVGSLALLATRMATRPVEEAARVSQRLATGHLDERMPVRGTDEVAQLGRSFNTMADSIQHQIRELRTLSRLQQRFVSDVSHELRTPLTTMRMAGEVLHASRDDFPAPVARSAELLRQELDRFEELLTELLEISRYDSGAAQVERHEEDLVALVTEAVDGVRPLAQRLGSGLRLHLPTGPVPVAMDGRRVSRVLRNLLGNAVEHGEGRPVDITVAAATHVASVAVRDHGIGLSDEQQAMVFDRFWRADPARTRTTGGTGLGLAISLEDARVHGGWLQVGGAPGRGACFRLVLPRSAAFVIAEAPPRVVSAADVEAELAADAAVPEVVLALASRVQPDPDQTDPADEEEGA